MNHIQTAEHIIKKYDIAIDDYQGSTVHERLLSWLRSECEKSKWRYMREGTQASGREITCLRDYLAMIHPGWDFVINEKIPVKIQQQRGTSKMRNFQPDARCEEHNLVVEFDGLDHYETLKGVYMDKARDEWYGSLEYHVVHIPYWMPTGPSELSYLFGAHVSEGCELKLGIFGSPDSTYLKHGFGIGNSPATFCEQGALRFAEEFQRLPYETREMVMDDLDLVTEANIYGLDALPSCIASLRAWQRVHC